MKFRKILIIHPSPMVRNLIRGFLLSEFTDVRTKEAENKEEALDYLESYNYDVILCAATLADDEVENQGVEGVIVYLKMKNRMDRFVLLTNSEKAVDQYHWSEQGVGNFLLSPFEAKDVIAKVNYLADPVALRQHVRYDIVGAHAILFHPEQECQCRILNISYNAVLLEVCMAEDFPDLLEVNSMMIEFPTLYQGVSLSNLQPSLSKLHVLERDGEGKPTKARVVWLFDFPNESEQEKMKDVLHQVASNLELMQQAAI